MATGEELQVFTVDQESVNSAEISPDDKTLFSTTGDDGQIVTLRDVATGEELTLTGHKWKVVCKSFSSDGKTLATGSYDNTARLWDVATGKELQILSEHGGSVSGVSFSPDGKILATVSYDQTAKLWDVATGKELHTLRGHRGWIYHVSFSPDGKTLVTGGNNDKTVRLWDVDTGKDLYTSTELPVDEITGVRFSPDGQTLIVNTKWNGDILWDFGLDKLMQKGCEWIGNYLSNHPEETELQQICQPYLSGKSNPKP
jgi:WD40 repeat protein